VRLDKINAVGGTFLLICGVLLYLSRGNLTPSNIIIQSAGVIGGSYLVSVLIHLLLTKKMGKNIELVTVYAWYSSLIGLSIVIVEIVSLFSAD
tara:strand:- start:235 stop:513 length:279 start_codon:yes stop_codon:yes gene_type:complete